MRVSLWFENFGGFFFLNVKTYDIWEGILIIRSEKHLFPRVSGYKRRSDVKEDDSMSVYINSYIHINTILTCAHVPHTQK